MSVSKAYFFVYHGSRDRRPEIAVKQLAQLILHQLQVSSKLIGTGSLEFSDLPLHQNISQFALQAIELGIKHLQVIPLFLLPGVHVQVDIPEEVEQAQQYLGDKLKIEILPYFGSYPNLINVLAKQFEMLNTQGRILLSHGSRYQDANKPIEVIATELQAVAAYWAVSPSLAEQVEVLVKTGKQSIGIIPYFIFPGGITDLISNQIKQLQSIFQGVKLLPGEPLGATPEIASLIVQRLINQENNESKMFR